MKLTYKYSRYNFFGDREYVEDTTHYQTPAKFKKAFAAFKKDVASAVEIDGDLNFDSIVVYWESQNEYDNEVVTVKLYKQWNSCDIQKMSFSKMKKLINGYLNDAA